MQSEGRGGDIVGREEKGRMRRGGNEQRKQSVIPSATQLEPQEGRKGKKERRPQRQPRRRRGTSGAGRTEVSEESVSGLCLGYNLSSCDPFTHTVGANYWKISDNDRSKRAMVRFKGRGRREPCHM